MADWQRRVWADVVALEGVEPPARGRVLVVGDGLPVDFAPEVAVVQRAFGEKVADNGGFHRIVVLAHGAVQADFALLLKQMWPLLRPDGQLVVVAARPNPWGVRHSDWCNGLPRRRWLRWLKRARWLIAEDVTAGGGAFWRRVFPLGGVVRVFVCQKRIGGTKVLVEAPEGVVGRPVGVPV